MEDEKTLTEYLKFSKQKRSRLISLANQVFEEVVKLEERKYKSRQKTTPTENSFTANKTHIVLQPIQKKLSKTLHQSNGHNSENF